jgi:hypothetical protein
MRRDFGSHETNRSGFLSLFVHELGGQRASSSTARPTRAMHAMFLTPLAA